MNRAYPAFFMSAACHYLGPSLAVILFERLSVPAVAWMRVLSAATVFALWRRPWRNPRLKSSESVRVFVPFGVVLGAMNLCFYAAIARLPLATVSTIEFAGPIALAAFGVRSGRNLFALCLAVAGVTAMGDATFSGAPLGFVFAFANCALFTLYIIIGHRIAAGQTARTRVDTLAGAMLVAAAALAPAGIVQSAPAFTDPVVFGAAVAVGVCSSVIPYVLDQFVMSRVPRATFALMLALLPLFATVIGAAVLRQIPTLKDAAGIALVTFGVALHRVEEL